MAKTNARITARRVHDELKGIADPRVIFFIAAIAEDHSHRIQEINELAKQIDTLATLMNSFVHVQAGMGETLKKMRDIDGDKPHYEQAKEPDAST